VVVIGYGTVKSGDRSVTSVKVRILNLFKYYDNPSLQGRAAGAVAQNAEHQVQQFSSCRVLIQLKEVMRRLGN
jgi:hypothetical protein